MHPLKTVRKTVQLFAVSALLSLLGLAWPQSARAQFIGDVGLQTVNPLLANNATCTGSVQSFAVQNVGQIGHQATATSSTAASLTMEIDASDASGAIYRISNPQISFNNGTPSAYIVQANGYYPQIFVLVTCSAGATFTLTYAGAQTAFNSVIGPSGGTPVPIGGSVAANVQGVVTQGTSAGTVLPIIDGGLELPVNNQFLAVGLDSADTGAVGVPVGTGGIVNPVILPNPTQSNELAIVFDGNQGDFGATNALAPFVSPTGIPTLGQFTTFSMSNPGQHRGFFRSYTNSTPGGTELAIGVLVQTPGVSIRNASSQQASASPFTTSATLGGSLLLVGIECASNTTACVVGSLSDSQGHTWIQLAAISTPLSSNIPGISVWAPTTLSTAGADTITITMSTGTFRLINFVEVPAVQPAILNTPAISVQSDPTGATVERQDAQFPNQFVCNVTLSTNTTTQCQAAPTTINSVPVRAYVTDFQINTPVAGGSATTLQLKTGTGTNCGTGTANLSAITYPNNTAGLTNILGMRTPLIAPLQSAVCVTQAGTTANTSTIEIHGFFAP